ncbi:glycoside hydrolase family 5 protein [Clostridium estertheticum]|uniref:glycoside hydrolase family 5 protein n=1 Tax=Clostridium estertheticum TaxID=238834 RepID=UPI001C7CF224|nr:glycoside hydrolase family 5 protein [Clostridium estertheticum]MBX4264058.1 glycoside hydrolase family 5 protein [Clostridium estertheticum]WLC87163.1 glycoside hydrolase family 5 protein [Clostridium estertheticum]
MIFESTFTLEGGMEVTIRDKIDYAMAKGIAVFVTELETSDASGLETKPISLILNGISCEIQ